MIPQERGCWRGRGKRHSGVAESAARISASSEWPGGGERKSWEKPQTRATETTVNRLTKQTPFPPPQSDEDALRRPLGKEREFQNVLSRSDRERPPTKLTEHARKKKEGGQRGGSRGNRGHVTVGRRVGDGACAIRGAPATSHGCVRTFSPSGNTRSDCEHKRAGEGSIASPKSLTVIAGA